jgi:acetyltransferase
VSGHISCVPSARCPCSFVVVLAVSARNIDAPAEKMCALYPVRARLRDGTGITIRPIGPQDTLREQAFMQALSPQSRYFRFMSVLRELPPDMLYRFTHPDPDREVALVALAGEDDEMQQVGVARCIVEDGERGAEFALAVADDWQSRGVGRRLMCELMRAARTAGIRSLHGDVLSSNRCMLALMRTLGFDIMNLPEDATMRRVVKNLEPSHKDFVHAT